MADRRRHDLKIDWSELLLELKPKPGDNGDCFSRVELMDFWGMSHTAVGRLLHSAVRAGIIEPVKVMVADAFGSVAPRCRYRLVRKKRANQNRR